jgi:asparagine synthase (glutamine-hydrolysing)
VVSLCGIAGVWGKTNDELMDLMLKKIKHRGPDQDDKKLKDHYAIGHNRLSIIDVDGGRQPITNEDKTLELIFNGEVYNFHNIKKTLSSHDFKTNTDSEVILHLFEEKGHDVVRHLDGMFAFAICSDQDLFMARDPLGIKPLYYGYKEEKLYFSSEIKSLIKATSDIKEFPAGHYFTVKNGFKKYYDLPKIPSEFDTKIDEIIKNIQKNLEKAVLKRLVSDVPLGVFLSGGLDSSIISSIARNNTAGILHSFSVGTPDSPDIFYSKIIAKKLGTKHHIFNYGPKEIIKVLPEVIYFLESFDAALVRSAIPTYFVSKIASDYVKVVLSGEGADEIFGGYHYLKQFNKSHEMLQTELLYITESLHNTNLQRADRMTMANSIEARVPFLDIKLLNEAFMISPGLKLHADQNGGKKTIEKWILRRSAEKYLPADFIWRKKEKFAIGSGTAQILEQYADEKISDREFKKMKTSSEIKFNSKEELLYYKIFRGYYPQENILQNIGKSRSLNPGVICN